MMLVTLQQASDYLRRDTTDDDLDLELIIGVASDLVLAHLDGNTGEFIDSNGEMIEDSNGDSVAPDRVKGAVLYLTGWLYRNRDADADKAFGAGDLPAPVVAMLRALRDPALA